MEILKEALIKFKDLTSDVVTLETADVLLTAGDALFATLGAFQYLPDGGCHRLLIVRVDIEGVGAACLFETGTCAGYHRSPRSVKDRRMPRRRHRAAAVVRQ